MQLESLSGLELGELVNKRELSPIDVIKYFQNRFENINYKVNAFTYTKFDEALEEAKILDKRLAKGEYCGQFAGVPIALKDFLDSKKGWTNSHGGVKHLVRTDNYDSMFYKAAKSLGAIAIGKTNAPAFGFSGACENQMYGATRNPFDLTRTSGGSSGGTASAVASGLILFGEGGDAGGSIRIPANWCNLFGFKASLGTIPSYCRPDGWAATHPYCVNGALTKTVSDSAMLLNSMAQYNPRDPISLPINSNKNFLELMNKPVKGMKIGFTDDFNLFPVDSEVRQIVRNAAYKFLYEGAQVEFVSFDWKHTLDEIFYCWSWAISVDTALDLVQWKSEGLDLVKDYRHELPEEFIYFNEVAKSASIFDMKVFNEIRTDILDNFESIFDKYDVIISPVAICPPMKLNDNGKCLQVDGSILNPKLNFLQFAETALVNFVGYPAASVPAGLTSDNLPIGMHIIGKQYKDEDVLALSRMFEILQPWNQNYNLSM